MEEIVGTIENVVYTSEETGFSVIKLLCPREKILHCIVGNLPGVQPGETITCKGNWKRHPQYGSQFEVLSFEVRMPTDLSGIQKYLESGLIKGIGPVYAKKIIDRFGINTLEVIDHDPSALLDIPGIGKKRVEIISKHWGDQKSIRDVMIFLRSHNIRPSLAQKIFKVYGEQSINVVKENPYKLAKTIFGIGFKSVDQIAINLGIAKNSSIRIDSALEHMLWDLSLQGHVCYPKDSLLEEVEKLVSVSQEEIEKRLHFLLQEGRIASETIEYPYIWIKPLFLFEKGIVEEIHRLQRSKEALRLINPEKAFFWAQKAQSLTFAHAQKQAIIESFSQKIHIITGGPGTGKSTITNVILSIAEKLTSAILLATPTGRAAKRLSEITRKKTFTIHSLLEFDFTNRGFKKNRKNPLACDVIIIDEVSMIDTFLLYYLLRAIPSHAKLILIGDVDQLPSVGPGNILKDFIDSEKISVTRLTTIFRQAENSQIVVNAHRINQGLFPQLSFQEKSDFFFYPVDDPSQILGEILYQITEFLPKKFSLHPIEDIQVLSPMKKGVLGTENVNHVLQQRLNPSDFSINLMGRSFHKKDKVMQIRNNYTKGVYNGDIGRIVTICQEERIFSVQFDIGEVLYDFSEMDELSLSYAVSVHKYQGSECPCIIMPVHMSHYMLLFKNLLYTAITRGKKLVVLVGSKKALAIAVRKNDPMKRFTGLCHFLKTT